MLQKDKISMSTKAICGNCKQKGASICGQCKYVSYCSIECQRADWPKHKEECEFLIIIQTDISTGVDINERRGMALSIARKKATINVYRYYYGMVLIPIFPWK